MQSGEDWLKSTIVINVNKSSHQKRRGKHVMLPYVEVKKRFGVAVAAGILAEKKQRESNKPAGSAITYWMEHPDAKGQEVPWLQHTSNFQQNFVALMVSIQSVAAKHFRPHKTNISYFPLRKNTWTVVPCLWLHWSAQDWNLLRIWDALEFEEEHTEGVSMGMEATGECDPSQTKQLLQLVFWISVLFRNLNFNVNTWPKKRRFAEFIIFEWKDVFCF